MIVFFHIMSSPSPFRSFRLVLSFSGSPLPKLSDSFPFDDVDVGSAVGGIGPCVAAASTGMTVTSMSSDSAAATVSASTSASCGGLISPVWLFQKRRT